MNDALAELLIRRLAEVERRLGILERQERAAGVTTSHSHSKLVASDGVPDPAISADAAGAMNAAVSLTSLLFLLPAPTTLTIASGQITVTQSFHTIDTEGAAATDDLTAINGGVDGMLLFLKTASDSRDVVLIDSATLCLGGDRTLNDTSDMICLMYYNTKWRRFAGPTDN